MPVRRPPSRSAAVAAAASLALAVASPAQSPWPGYHIDVTALTGELRIYDLGGQLVRSFANPLPGYVYGELAKPLDNGAFMALIVDPRVPSGTPRRKLLGEFDASGGLRWLFDASPYGRGLHHDFERLANGNTLVCAQEVVFEPSLCEVAILDDVVMEVDPSGAAVWEWSLADHWQQLPVTPAGWKWLIAQPGMPKVLFHLNSLQSLPANRWEATDPRFRAGNLLLSCRQLNLVLVVDRATGSVVWSMIDETVGQHHARMIPPEMPGAGNLLIFDNGGAAGAPAIARPYSRVVEFVPGSLHLVWAYRCGEPLPPYCRTGFFSGIMGSAQRLPNGNTVIADSDSGRVFEVAADRTTVWENTAAWVYRGYRWELDWPSGKIAPFTW